ncbi:hypothetical protein PF010_g9517, partial [Phytophthora fragariae]
MTKWRSPHKPGHWRAPQVWLHRLPVLLRTVGITMLLLQMLSLPLSPTLRRHGTDADFVDAHNTEWEVSEEDLQNLSLLHESCVTDTNAVLPWQYGAPGHHRPNGVATNPHEVIHENDPDLLQKLRQCPDVDIFLPIGLHGNGYCEDAVAYAKYLKSRLLPLWALEVKLFDPEVGHEVDYYNLYPTTPMIFFQHYWDGVPSSPRWPDQKPVYLMPNIEMVELTPEHYWRVDVVLCKIKVCCFLDGLKEAMPDAAKWARDWDFFQGEAEERNTWNNQAKAEVGARIVQTADPKIAKPGGKIKGSSGRNP